MRILHNAKAKDAPPARGTAEQELGPSEGWSIQQWKDFANNVLKSEEPAISEFLDELEENNPGAKAALAASAASYRVSASLIARVVISSFFRTGRGFLGTLILCLTCDQPMHEEVHSRFLIPKPNM